MRTFGIDGGTGCRLDARRIRRMIAVGMGDEDMGHGLAAHGVEQCRRMRLAVRTGIDDRNLATPYDVADCPGKGERTRIVAEDAPHTGPHLFGYAGQKREIAIER